MTAWVENIARALADRKGITAMEYAVIAAGAATVVAACYRTFFERVCALLATIVFV